VSGFIKPFQLDIVALSDIVVNDALVLIDHATYLKRHASHLAAEFLRWLPSDLLFRPHQPPSAV
jgi:hypothetical protein